MYIPNRFCGIYLDSIEPKSEDQKVVLEKMKELFDWELAKEKRRVYEIANANDDDHFSRIHCTNVKAYDRYIELKEEFRQKLKDRKWCMCLLGYVGSGKTTLACAFANSFEKWVSGSSIQYETVATLTQAYKSNFNKEVIDELVKSSVLIIDELRNTKEFTDYNKSIFQEVLDLRYANNKITLLVGNVKAETLVDMFDDYIISRLQTGIIVQMAGEDLREQGG